MKPFTKSEILGLVVIFLVLIAISVPNFVLSLRRARDQIRRDDLGALVAALIDYDFSFNELPPASTDGKIMDCIKPGTSVTVDKKGRLVVNLIACEWGKDSLVDLTPGSKVVFMPLLPRDPDFKQGVTYLYFSDGQRFQLLASLEGGKDEADYNADVVKRNIMCGTRVCNMGRAYGVPLNISIEEYDRQLLESTNK